jgi:hypothetical protein
LCLKPASQHCNVFRSRSRRYPVRRFGSGPGSLRGGQTPRCFMAFPSSIYPVSNIQGRWQATRSAERSGSSQAAHPTLKGEKKEGVRARSGATLCFGEDERWLDFSRRLSFMGYAFWRTALARWEIRISRHEPCLRRARH